MIAKGIYFGEVHSYNDLNLVLAAGGVDIPPPKPKTNYVDVPGGHGSIDLTEAHGKINYNDRECKFTFVVHPSDQMTFEEKKSQVAGILNGKQCNIVLDKDQEYYYSGRCAVDDWQQDKNHKMIVVTARVAPYKYKRNETVVSFALTSTAQTVTLRNGAKSVVPTITCTENATIVFNNFTLQTNGGTTKILDLCLSQGDNQMTISGSGTITFTYREGEM